MPSMLTNLGCAGSAAVITVTGIHPIDTVKTRLQVSGTKGARNYAALGISGTRLMNQPADGAKVYNNIADTFVKIATKEGPLTLWAGFIPMWARIAPTTTFQLLFFEYFSKLAGISAT